VDRTPEKGENETIGKKQKKLIAVYSSARGKKRVWEEKTTHGEGKAWNELVPEKTEKPETCGCPNQKKVGGPHDWNVGGKGEKGVWRGLFFPKTGDEKRFSFFPVVSDSRTTREGTS